LSCFERPGIPGCSKPLPEESFQKFTIGDVLRLWRISIVKVMLMFDRGLQILHSHAMLVNHHPAQIRPQKKHAGNKQG
jgi:hypothetical protein